jgi:sodium/potassium-transporting ATPase subunit alpha
LERASRQGLYSIWQVAKIPRLKCLLFFPRTTAEQKLVIVEQLQKRNEIVTMIGDGVSDAPALKRANVGVAMGVAGRT